MANPKGNNAKTKRKAQSALDTIRAATKSREDKSIAAMRQKPANWRDTDITNTDYWACKPKET